MTFFKGHIYLIEWIDCETDLEWTRLKDFNDWMDGRNKEKFDYIGRFIVETPEYYCFENGINYDKESTYFSKTIFPKGMVKKSKELKYMACKPKKKKKK